MNRKVVTNMVGKILLIESALMLLPLLVSFLYQESCGWAFLLTIGITATVGAGMMLPTRNCDRMIFAREGFVIVAVTWTLMSAFGALPFVISGEIPSFTDAYFEVVSGFTTTGASILNDVESMSIGLLFWRSFTHWVGGMGVLMFIMAIFPSESGRTIHIMRAEVPGPIVGKLVPRIRDTAKLLYLIYIALTIVQILLLLAGGVPFLESVIHAFGTAGTGGFGIKGDSIAGYSPYLQWVITIFMLIFGVNFNLYYLILVGRGRSAMKSGELWVYLSVVAAATMMIVFSLGTYYPSFEETLRHAAFQAASIITTTGYSTTDFDLWPGFSKTVLMILMFIGGCAGSTAGGLKISRVMLLFKSIGRNLRHMIHPRSVGVVKLEGKKIEEQTLNGVGVYLCTYFVLLLSVFLLLSLEPFDMETIFSATVTCFNNVGPGFGGVGPTSSFAAFSDPAKWLLSLTMLLGRLELYPILLALSPATWIKK